MSAQNSLTVDTTRRTPANKEIIIELQDLSYQERLTVLNSETLEYRHLHMTYLSMYYKVFHNPTLWAHATIVTLLYHRLCNLHSVFH